MNNHDHEKGSDAFSTVGTNKGVNPGSLENASDPFFDELIFVAKRLRDATTLESLLTKAGIDYTVEPDQYEGGLIFKSMRVGAFFYVRPELRERAIAVMLENGYIPAK
jgi:hypothetical protein